MKVIFTPCAQNTIIRPLAQAICLANGGEPVEYIDTADHKKKTVSLEQLHFLNLEVKVKNKNVNVEAGLVALRARHEPVQVQVNVNDVEVMVDAKTTPDQALAQFHQKYKQSVCVAHRKPAKRQIAHQNIKG